MMATTKPIKILLLSILPVSVVKDGETVVVSGRREIVEEAEVKRIVDVISLTGPCIEGVAVCATSTAVCLTTDDDAAAISYSKYIRIKDIMLLTYL